DRDMACGHFSPEARRLETAPFLIRPVDDLDGGLGLDTGIVERAYDFEARQNAEGAIETAAGRLRVQVAADQHRRERIVAAPPPRKHVAYPVDPDRQPGFLAPAGEEVAPRLILVGGCQPADAVALNATDLRHRHMSRPQPLAIDLRQFHHGSPLSAKPATWHPRSDPDPGPALKLHEAERGVADVAEIVRHARRNPDAIRRIEGILPFVVRPRQLHMRNRKSGRNRVNAFLVGKIEGRARLFLGNANAPTFQAA